MSTERSRKLKKAMHKKVIRNYFLRACFAVYVCAFAPIGTAFRASAQTPSNDMSFEVATIKPVFRDASHPFDPKHFWVHVSPTGASYWSMTLDSLITHAYNIESFQIVGPEWANADLFDIEARFPEGADRKEEQEMLQALLKERFKLSFRIEKKELDGYVLVVGKHGEKLRPSLPDHGSPASLEPGDTHVREKPAKSGVNSNRDGSTTINMGDKGTLTVKFDQESWTQHFEFSKMTMEDLASKLSGCLGDAGHKVTDETGIKGTYQVAYDCPLPRPRRPADPGATGALPPDPQDGPLLIRSLDAAGLKLEKRKVPMDVYVIDRVDRPSAN